MDSSCALLDLNLTVDGHTGPVRSYVGEEENSKDQKQDGFKVLKTRSKDDQKDEDLTKEENHLLFSPVLLSDK